MAGGNRYEPGADVLQSVLHRASTRERNMSEETGQLVQIVGETVQGTGINGVPTTYVRVYSPDFGVTGYVNAYFIG